jgi:K+-sensing histidine kinase KdpD
MQVQEHLKKYQEIYFGTIIGLSISIADFFLDFWVYHGSWDSYLKEHSIFNVIHVYEHFVFLFIGVIFGFIWYSTANQYRKHVSLTQQLKEENNFNQLLLDIIVHDIANNNFITHSFLLLLFDEVNDPTTLSYLKKINNMNAKTILLTENINVLSKLKSSTINIISINLRSAVMKTIAQIEMAFKNDDLHINTNIPDNLFISAHDLIENVFINLISNSVQYRKKDQKVTKIDIEASSTEKGVLISFSDFGQGIDNQMKAKLFTRYERDGENIGFRKGLGLSIIKRVIDLLDGEIWFDNRPESLDDHSAGTVVNILLKPGEKPN